jgi:dTDP-4-dehydrorhamnose reductase
MASNVLLVGKTGQLGWELQWALACLGTIHAIDYPELDLRDQGAVRSLVRSVRPDIIVNAAAYTDVNGAESQTDVARQINAVAPGVLAAELRQSGGRLIVHYSTDYVFDGAGTRPYLEDDPANPVNAYGRTKLEGEQAVAASGVPYLIFRTEWLYGARGKNFLLSILRLAREGKPLRIVADQVGAPTTARMLAESTALALACLTDSDPGAVSGIYHATAAGQASWYEFAKAILEECCALESPAPEWCRRALQSVQPMPSSEYISSARRPAYSLLSTEKLARVFGIAMPHWRDQLRLCVQELQGTPVLS